MSFDPKRKVKIVSFNAAWAETFRVESDALEPVLGNIALGIHHIGSTSIPGACAKPIIDMMPVVTDINLIGSLNYEFEAIGYVPREEFGIPGRRFFTKDTAGERSHHIHIYQVGHPEIIRHLAFRDYLRSHPEQLAAYCLLKNDLARRYPDDINAYTDGKTVFIREIDKRAAASRSLLPEAIILIGPTGSGKTPLGALLEKEGLSCRKCFHFDFGSQLRRYAAHPTGLLSESDLAIVSHSLSSGSLLTDEQFPIAENLLRAFVEEFRVGCDSLIILNGLPRHAGQAAALEKIVQMKMVIVLDCNAAVALERIRTDAGGDRGRREDDTAEDISRKLAIFAEKTLPLVRYCEGRGVPVIRVPVATSDSAAIVRNTLVSRLSQFLGQLGV